jgi:tRNA 2-selenouridine synthase
VKAGIEYVSRSLPRIYESFANLTKQRRILVFCARGGMRSESVAGLFASIGFPVTKLTNGYKGYRQHILLKLPELIAQKKFVTLYGKTGTGKTHILHEIERLGYDILDLEACANHRGSLLGAVGLPIKRSQKQFETLLYNALYNAKSDTIFTEGESKRIGTIYIPNELMDRLDCGRKLVIEATIETRKEVIREDYIGDNFDKASAIEGLTKLVRYIGTERVQEYTDLIESASYDKVIEELMIRYYDIVYNTTDSHERTFLNTSAEETAKEIVEYIFPF